MAKAKSELVRELIEEERYDEAREILRRINNPTAKKLLEELDELDPVRKSPSPLVVIALMSLGLVIVLAVIAVLLSQQSAASGGQSEAAIPTLIPFTPAVQPTEPPSTSGAASVQMAGSTPDVETTAPTVFAASPTPVPPTATMTATPVYDVEAMRRTLYTFCMRKGDDVLCQEISNQTSLQQDSNVLGCFEQFGSALDDFGNCIRPQYADVYGAAWKRIHAPTVVPEMCKAYPNLFGVPEGDTMIPVCTQHSKDMVSRNPYYIVDTCFDTYLNWNKVYQLRQEAIDKRVLNFALCVWQKKALPDS